MFEYRPYVPRTIYELVDQLGSMMLSSPGFEDKGGYFQEMNINTEFFALNEGLKGLKAELGEERYGSLRALSERMRAHFEADPDDESEDARKGRAIIRQMEDLLMQAASPKKA